MKQEKRKIEEEEDEVKRNLRQDVFVVQESTKIEDGIHTGKINNIVHENREGFDYVDVYIDVADSKGKTMTIKTGFPAFISQNTGFGKFLTEAGFDLKSGEKLSLSEIKKEITGKPIAFQTITEDNFARIVNKSIRFK